MLDQLRVCNCPECHSERVVWGGVENDDQQSLPSDADKTAGEIINHWECASCGERFKERSPMRLLVSLEKPLDLLVDKYGWAAVLKALGKIATRDGFQQLSAALEPVYDLISDAYVHRPTSREG